MSSSSVRSPWGLRFRRLFYESLVRNQDDEFSFRISASSGSGRRVPLSRGGCWRQKPPGTCSRHLRLPWRRAAAGMSGCGWCPGLRSSSRPSTSGTASDSCAASSPAIGPEGLSGSLGVGGRLPEPARDESSDTSGLSFERPRPRDLQPGPDQARAKSFVVGNPDDRLG
jgi:hypothetical protein